MCVLIVLCVFLMGILCDDNPNFVFVLTDDQDLLLNGLKPMEKTIKLVANEGVTFQNAFVNTPICCPSRSTILTGKYPHNLKVFNNSLSGNCSSRGWQQNFEGNSIANLLKTNKNYATFYAGKYLNQYGNKNSGGLKHVPAGYDWWIGLAGNSKYYDYSLSLNGTQKDFKNQYLTDVISDYAIDFLNQKMIQNRSFFMTVAPPGPHSPFTPAKRHIGAFKGTKALRTPNFNYTSYQKHWIVEMPPKFLPTNVTTLDEIQQNRMETLLSIDELIERIIIKLKDLSILDKTYVIFTSDNGFHIGQFSQPWDKRQPYETDIRVPFFMSGPKIKRKSLEKKPISSIDILPTILDLASIEIPSNIDGISFKPYLFNNNLRIGRNNIFIEYFGEGSPESVDENCHFPSGENVSQCTLENWCKCQDSRNNTYICVKIMGKYEDVKYCKFYDELNFVEVYDLKRDPYEMENIYKKLDLDENLRYEELLERFRNNKL